MNEHISILQGYIDHLEYMKKNAYEFFDREQADRDIEAFKAAIGALEQEPVLDKIRSEIESHCGLVKENHCKYCSYCNSVMGVREMLEIIDKYKAESEQ